MMVTFGVNRSQHSQHGRRRIRYSHSGALARDVNTYPHITATVPPRVAADMGERVLAGSGRCRRAGPRTIDHNRWLTCRKGTGGNWSNPGGAFSVN